RESSSLVGNVMLYLDYSAPVDIIREKFNAILKESKRWNGKGCVAQVTDFKEGTMELRLLMSARSSGQTFDLRCEVREKLIDFLQREHPEALPHSRQIGFKRETEASREPDRLQERNRGRRRGGEVGQKSRGQSITCRDPVSMIDCSVFKRRSQC